MHKGCKDAWGPLQGPGNPHYLHRDHKHNLQYKPVPAMDGSGSTRYHSFTTWKETQPAYYKDQKPELSNEHSIPVHKVTRPEAHLFLPTSKSRVNSHHSFEIDNLSFLPLVREALLLKEQH